MSYIFCSSSRDGLSDGRKRSNSSCFVGCCFWDLLELVRSILIHLAFSLWVLLASMGCPPCTRIDTATIWKKSRFILSDKPDFDMIHNLSKVVHAFAGGILTAFSVDEILLLGYKNLSINFRSLPLKMNTAFSRLKLIKYFICVSLQLLVG